ncbi:serine hydrolase domain-containing protein [Paenibacillus paridis]|uniref:serine hydrolase domain-containing protein n=1 Tax=Paenibacillus paridis TaxID=2583376 RepID=UPI001EE40E35|nr:serine hydrolase domain-containing protein [Paenibacillus paridis]
MTTAVNGHFKKLNDYAAQMQGVIGATAAAVYILKEGAVVNEWYSGRQAAAEKSKLVCEHTQFNVASIRKTYLALAVSLLVEIGLISCIDNELGSYLPEYREAARGVTIRHLLTHTHGLIDDGGSIRREFASGEGWAYRNAGIAMLIQLVNHLSGQTLSEFMRENVIERYQLSETGWRTAYDESLIYNYYEDHESWVGPNNSAAGDQSNLFVSARNLARWGYIHLVKGQLEGIRCLPPSVFDRVAALQTPNQLPAELPRHGYLWWLQRDTLLNELGERLPNDSYQILGITGCSCLVIPRSNAVVVRMYNQLSSVASYNYLNDIRHFGNLAYDLLSTYPR